MVEDIVDRNAPPLKPSAKEFTYEDAVPFSKYANSGVKLNVSKTLNMTKTSIIMSKRTARRFSDSLLDARGANKYVCSNMPSWS